MEVFSKMELKFFIPLLGVLVGAFIATATQIFLTSSQRKEALTKLKISKIEESLESIAYFRSVYNQLYGEYVRYFENVASEDKKGKSLASPKVKKYDELWKHSSKIETLLKAYVPHLSEYFDAIEEKIKTSTTAINDSTKVLIEGDSMEDLEHGSSIAKSACSSVREELNELADELQDKLYSEIRDYFN